VAAGMSPLLELRGLGKSFGGLTAVRDLYLHVEEGESLGLIGPNGAGKTTVFNLIMAELRQDEGEIVFGGEEISRLPTHARVKKGISRTYQVPRPFHEMSVLDNIRVGMMPDNLRRMIVEPNDEVREMEIARSVGFGERETAMYPGELSMGDVRRLELARTIAAEPKLLLLDEVFAGLAIGEIAQISKLLLEKRKSGLTYIIVSHDLRSLAPLVDRVVAMYFGSTLAEGTFDEVIADKQVQEAYLGQ
jgi:ABC-type branched-subunit amino acid transport system ATPase component